MQYYCNYAQINLSTLSTPLNSERVLCLLVNSEQKIGRVHATRLLNATLFPQTGCVQLIVLKISNSMSQKALMYAFQISDITPSQVFACSTLCNRLAYTQHTHTPPPPSPPPPPYAMKCSIFKVSECIKLM